MVLLFEPLPKKHKFLEIEQVILEFLIVSLGFPVFLAADPNQNLTPGKSRSRFLRAVAMPWSLGSRVWQSQLKRGLFFVLAK